MKRRFQGNFTQQEPIPEAAIDAALRVLKSGRLHRYNVAQGEEAEAALLEVEFAEMMGADYCLAVTSGGYALTIALRAIGVLPGEKVLTNAFTLAPVPGAIAAAGGVPIFVNVTEELVIDLDHLDSQIEATGAKILMLSHMRGHICDMDALMRICDAAGVRVVEDCAHTMGARWKGVLSGRHGVAACYSTQTYKHVNSGEGGLLITDDPELMARATILSGSYMLYGRHKAAPPEEVFRAIRLQTPNNSGRMDNLRAAILRPQLRDLTRQIERWNARYQRLEAGLAGTPGLRLIKRSEAEHFVGSSFQFLLLDWQAEAIKKLLADCAARGVELKWFGAAEPQAFTSRYTSWTYAPSQQLPQTDRILDGLMDIRLPLTFSEADCDQIAGMLREEIGAAYQAGAAC